MSDAILKLVNTSNKRYDFDERINMLYYLKDYYPKNKFINSQLTDCQINDRNYVYKFKNGESKIAFELSKNLKEGLKAINFNPANFILIPIPASSNNSTLLRLYVFSKYLSSILKIDDGFDTIKTKDHSPFKGAYGIDKTQFLTFNSEKYQGKNVLLFDDLITTGETFGQVSTKILNTGAISVTGIFLAQTIR